MAVASAIDHSDNRLASITVLTLLTVVSCGDEFGLHNKKIRKALDAVAKTFDDLRLKLAKIVSPSPPF